jgi:hypothetical protein
MNKEVQALCKRIGRRSVVEELWRARKGHLRIHQQMRKNGAQPLMLRNLREVSQKQDRFRDVPTKVGINIITISASRAAMNCPAPPGKRRDWSSP